MGGWWDWGERKAGRPTKDESPKKEESRPRADAVDDDADARAERASIESVGSERSSSVIRREVEVLVLPALLL